MISSSSVGCHIGGIAVNIFAYADDIVLLASSWYALQDLLSLLINVAKNWVWSIILRKLNVWFWTLLIQDAQLSQRDRAAGCVIVFAKSGWLELGLGDNILPAL